MLRVGQFINQVRLSTKWRSLQHYGGVLQARAFLASSAVPMTKLSESFLDGTSSEYVEQMFLSWKKNPESVHSSWAAYFSNLEKNLEPGKAHATPPTLRGPTFASFPNQVGQSTPVAAVSSVDIAAQVSQTFKVHSLITAFRTEGHKLAHLDPLNLSQPKASPSLDYRTYGFTEQDLSKTFFVGGEFFGQTQLTLSDVLEKLKSAYCSTIAIQYMHLSDKTQLDWIRSKFETDKKWNFSVEEKRNTLDRLIWADKFEQFLKKKFGQDKRFGLDGSESLIPGMKALIDTAADAGVENIVMGMPHRGRLNVLANVVRKPLEAIFHEFAKLSPDQIRNQASDYSFHTGDVKYHLGTSYDRPTRTGKRVHLTLMSNPSHLEAVDPLVEGKTRAKQHYLSDEKRKRVMSLQLHGDAAFAGQGVVYETFQLSGTQNYSTGGVIHIVVNNQIGFTTDPIDARSTEYCTDLGKSFEAPIIHVNGDDPEAIVFACTTAAEWRQTFGKDIIIDLVCYRRWGHNELDEPKFTQPVMYNNIANHPSSLSLYIKHLTDNKILSAEEITAMEKNVDAILEKSYSQSSSYEDKKGDWLESRWVNFKSPSQMARIRPTGCSVDLLKKVGIALSTLPADFVPHPTIQRDMNRKKKMIETGEDIDWATAEALAFGTLLAEGNHVRLSGQDVQRGTFSHRHAVLHDQRDNRIYTPLNNIDSNQAKFEVSNSVLSEFAVLGFELGYSLENPNSLILWEAQFGDFANGAQVIIDQFLSCGENKWHRQSGLVLLLPHGYDGQGPEHSSCRLERFLQLSDSDPDQIPAYLSHHRTKQVQETNMVVANVTTPANYFHLLRRQVHRDFRKPLVVASPKNLLRHPLVKSKLADFQDDGDIRFQKVIGETEAIDSPKDIKKVIFCSGKVYYDLVDERAKRGIKNTAIVRIEQLAPFPFDQVLAQIKLYENAHFIWCQEEHKNMGAWSFVNPHFATLLQTVNHKQRVLRYVGRRVAASPATGKFSKHEQEKQQFLNEVFL